MTARRAASARRPTLTALCARRVRDRFPELPILLTTGYSEQVTGNHGFPVLQKPYELESLAAALSNVLKPQRSPDKLGTDA